MKLVNLVGETFGRLHVVEFAGTSKQKRMWRCECSCGRTSVVPTAMLKNGNTKSCGCLGVEARAQATSRANTTHGKSKTPTYGVWFNMIRRCEQSNHKSFHQYGGRGVKVCEEWKSFAGFLSDMGERPDGYTIDRIDTNGNYEPGNCRWATQKTQQNNRRNNRLLTANGLTMTMQAWAEVNGLTADAISKRIDSGWSVDRAVTQPMKSDRRRLPELEKAGMARPVVVLGQPLIVGGYRVWEAVTGGE